MPATTRSCVLRRTRSGRGGRANLGEGGGAWVVVGPLVHLRWCSRWA
jgi:hypothetical protein